MDKDPALVLGDAKTCMALLAAGAVKPIKPAVRGFDEGKEMFAAILGGAPQMVMRMT